MNRPDRSAARPGGLPIEVLVPNGDRRPFYPGHPIHLGAALHIVEPLNVHDTEQLHDVALTSPWAPIAVRPSDHPAFAILLSAWRAGPCLSSLLVLPDDGSKRPHEALHRALRVAEPPSPDAIAGYITERVGSPQLGETVLAEWLGKPSPSRQARHGRFARAGTFVARDWKDALRLVLALCHCHDATVEAIAGAVERDPRTLRLLADRLLRMPISMARTGFGWRWAVELILRHHGYLEGEEPVEVAVGAPSPRVIDEVLWEMRSRRVVREA